VGSAVVVNMQLHSSANSMQGLQVHLPVAIHNNVGNTLGLHNIESNHNCNVDQLHFVVNLQEHSRHQ